MNTAEKKNCRIIPAKIIFPLAALLVFTMSFLLIRRTDSMRQASARIAHTYEIKLLLEGTLSSLREAESAQRGFIITRDSSYILSQAARYEQINAHLSQLKLLVAENPLKQQQMDTLLQLVTRRIQMLETILQDAPDQQNSARQNLVLRQSRALMTQVHSLAASMTREEGQLLQARKLLQEKHFFYTPLYAGLLVLVSLLFLTISYLGLRRQLRISKTYLRESRLANDKLKETNTLFENAEKVGSLGSWTKSPDSPVPDYSNNFYRIFGLDPNTGEKGADCFQKLVDADGWKQLLQDIERAQQTRSTALTEYWITRPDGQRRRLRSVCSFSEFPNGQGAGAVQDITEEYLLRQQLQQHHHLIEQVVENNTDLIAAFDSELRIILANKAARELYGKQKEEIIGKKITDVLPGLGSQKLACMQAALKGQETLGIELSFQNGQRLAEMSYIPLRNSEGLVNGVLTLTHDVTEIKNITRQLAEINTVYKNAENAGRIGSWKWNYSTNEVTHSDNMFRLFGYEPGEFDPGTNSFIHLMDEADRKLKEPPQFVSSDFQNGKTVTIEYWLTCRNGIRRRFRSIGKFYLNENGEKIGTGTVQDITEEYLLWQKLRERTELVEQVIENNTDMISVYDNELRVTLWNRACEEKIGLSKETILGKTLPEVLTYLQGDRKMLLMEQALSSGQPIRSEEAFLKGTRFADLHLIPLKNEEGETTGLLNISHDVTEIRQFAQQLQDANAIFENAEEVAAMGSWKWDLTSSKFKVSQNLFRMFGEEPGSIEPTFDNFLSFIHPDDREEMTGSFTRAIQSNAAPETLFRIIRKDGRIRHMKGAGRLLMDENHRPVLLGTVQDITDSKKAEEKLLELNQKLEKSNQELLHSNEELASFNYIASHDLQEPLRKIQTFCTILTARETAISPEGKTYLDRMQKAAARMRNLIHDLLSLSHVSVTRDTLQPIDLNSVLLDAKATLRAAIEEKEAILQADRLPLIPGVGFQLQQLFENLIGNALKYSKPDHAPFIRITAELLRASEVPEGLATDRAWHRICFQDNGIGFEQAYASKIFEMFQRLHSKDEYPGTGIGLAICKKIIQKHNGYILASGQQGEGARFEVYLPG